MNLDGVWQTDCLNLEDDVIKSKIHIQGNQWVQTHYGFEDEKCEKPYIQFQQKKKILIENQNLDLTELETTYTPLTSEVAEALNLIQYCQVTDWKVLQAQKVNGQNCQDYLIPKVGDVVYSILKVDKTSLQLGRSGKGKRGLSPEDRFVEVDSILYTQMPNN